MAKYKQVEFAKLCGIPKSSIPAYKSRNKLVIEDGLIDDDNPVNKAFLSKYSSRIPDNETKEVVDNVPIQPSSGPELKLVGLRKKNKGNDYHELEIIKKTLDIEKTQQEVQLLEKRNAKMDGENIPTDLVKSVISVMGKNFVIGFHQTSKNWLSVIAKMVKLTNAQIAEMDLELKKGANDAVEFALKESKKSISGIIKEHSLKREVGEHD